MQRLKYVNIWPYKVTQYNEGNPFADGYFNNIVQSNITDVSSLFEIKKKNLKILCCFGFLTVRLEKFFNITNV